MKLAGCLLLAACGAHDAPSRVVEAEPAVPAFALSSTAFADNAAIPAQFTCEGPDVSPPLAWSGAPAATKAYALVVDDPDAPDPSAPTRTWVHWVVTGIPSTVSSLAAGATTQLPAGASNGTNDFGKPAWGGPCPPIGRHRYFFTLYALDAAIGTPGVSKATLLATMKGHVLAKGVLVGTYQKQAVTPPAAP